MQPGGDAGTESYSHCMRATRLMMVKLAEDGSGDVVVRLYEALGTRAGARITATFDHASVAETDLLERPLPEPVALDGDRLRLRPFQIVTLRFERL